MNPSHYKKKYNPDYGYDAVVSNELAKTLKNEVNSGSSILDIGCGTGIVSKNFSNNKITLVDQDKQSLKIASKRIPHSEVLNCDFLDLNLEKKFDYVFMLGVIHEQKNQKNFLKKVRLNMKDGSKLFISYPNLKSLHRIAGEKMNIIESSLDSVTETAKSYGFDNVVKFENFERMINDLDLKVLKNTGVCLKPYPNEIMEKLDENIIEMLNKLTQKFDENACTRLLTIVTKN